MNSTATLNDGTVAPQKSMVALDKTGHFLEPTADNAKVKTPHGPKTVAPTGFGAQATVEMTRFKFWMVFGSLMMAVFLFALGMSLITTVHS